MHSSHALALADQLRARLDARGGTDHLKLQKLCFYAYGAALGLGVAEEIGTIVFDAWRHGPVSRPVWDAFKVHRAALLPPLDVHPNPNWGSPKVHQVVDDIVEVYGRLSSWDIRCESHLEEPWVRAMRARSSLSNDEIREHFARKFASGRVMLPAYFQGAQSASVDGIPRARFESLHDMAEALRARA